MQNSSEIKSLPRAHGSKTNHILDNQGPTPFRSKGISPILLNGLRHTSIGRAGAHTRHLHLLEATLFEGVYVYGMATTPGRFRTRRISAQGASDESCCAPRPPLRQAQSFFERDVVLNAWHEPRCSVQPVIILLGWLFEDRRESRTTSQRASLRREQKWGHLT